ncbi:tripartite-type tricarboxylate transporter receptor subunit TctC [Comamonas sp. BIGb0124]|uniref:tripartite tricarboxylate transporter substrate binding protein n=1 Tax=Comamonas sp. BIGb0124 TaxID=2485130 RepID=UPI000F9B0EEB|nr:tripartite tricarboxylate transporter substrate binding protein [Comamonas sp. BIGb0124]ROR18456.1 tripartite-type tricarboxylate transporter receptor subunit TctC [Comamonas sp. BIGb0124]
MKRRSLGALLPLLLAAPLAFGQAALPAKPIRLVVGGPPGGAPDTVARLIANHIELGQPVIVENKNGAAQMIAADAVARAPADGTTLLLASQTAIAVSPVLQKSKVIDPLRDFVGIGLIGTAPLVLVAGPALKAQNVRQLIEQAKAQPGEINFGNGGVGTTPHMAGVLFGYSAKIQLTSVPYPGEQAAMMDIMGERIHMMFANAAAALPHVRAGKLRALGVTSESRTPAAPDIPTIAESGVAGFSAATWLGIVAPAATPKEVVTKLNTELNRVLALSEVRTKLAAQGFEIAPMSTDAFGRFMRDEHAKWGKLIRDADIKAD